MVKKSLSIPSGVWGWQGTALVVLVVALPAMATLQLDPDSRSLSDAASVVGLVVYPVMLVSALMLYFAWRLSADRGRAWLSAAFTAIAVKGFSLAGLRAAYGEQLQAHATVLMIVDLVFALSVLTMVTVGHRAAPPIDPMVLGLTLGLAVTALRFGLMSLEPLFPLHPEFIGAATALLLGLHITFAYAVLEVVTTPAWARVRLALAVLLLGINRAMSYPSIDDTWASVIAVVMDASGAILLSTTALGMLRLAIRDSAITLDQLHERVELVEARNRKDRERLHEINATIAGIATAARLIHDPDLRLPKERRDTLQQMVDSEIARLERLVGNRGSALRDIDLDETLQPVVTAQRVLGRTIHWDPSGHVASGRADDVAEVVTTLLNNAAQHAPGSPVSVTVRQAGDEVEIHVADWGPGISREMSARIFEWGERGPASQGQGIGLNVAKRLVGELGGSLRTHSTAAGPGASFVVSLQASRNGHGAASARA